MHLVNLCKSAKGSVTLKTATHADVIFRKQALTAGHSSIKGHAFLMFIVDRRSARYLSKGQSEAKENLEVRTVNLHGLRAVGTLNAQHWQVAKWLKDGSLLCFHTEHLGVATQDCCIEAKQIDGCAAVNSTDLANSSKNRPTIASACNDVMAESFSSRCGQVGLLQPSPSRPPPSGKKPRTPIPGCKQQGPQPLNRFRFRGSWLGLGSSFMVRLFRGSGTLHYPGPPRFSIRDR